ncbi:MAG TPA: hypothetical protein VF026_28800, partial [Ktedonobacteraceae bacterium]
ARPRRHPAPPEPEGQRPRERGAESLSRQGKAAVLEEAAGILWCDAGARLGDLVVELGLDPRGDLAEVGLDLREGGSMGAKSGE